MESIKIKARERETYPPEIRAKALEIMKGTNITRKEIAARLNKIFKREVSIYAIAYWQKLGRPIESPYVNQKLQDKKVCELAKTINKLWKVKK